MAQQISEQKKLMSDDEILQKIKESQMIKYKSVGTRKKKPWLTYEYNHPGLWVN